MRSKSNIPMSAEEYYRAKLEYETDSYDLAKTLEKADDVVIVDARSAAAYEQEHILKAVNLPYKEMTPESTEDWDASHHYVVYCDGIGCNASTRGALMLTRLGFTVRELQGGLDWWKRDGYATEGTRSTEGKKIVCGC